MREISARRSVGVDGAQASRALYGMSMGSIMLCITLWIRAKTIGEDERGNAERRALFVGLWPPMFWLIGDTVAREHERRRSVRALSLKARPGGSQKRASRPRVAMPGRWR